jgi:hypothetical protein
MTSKLVKIGVGAPVSHAGVIREALATAGAGEMGNYSHASFSYRGIGRFKPLPGSNPTIGEIGKLEEVEEERIETICSREQLHDVVAAIRKSHPYEEPVIDVVSLEVV